MFKIGDRVQLNAEALKHCDPAIPESEWHGVVLLVILHVFPDLRIRFDDGAIEQHPASWFELEG